jgi:hypothetical protein
MDNGGGGVGGNKLFTHLVPLWLIELAIGPVQPVTSRFSDRWTDRQTQTGDGRDATVPEEDGEEPGERDHAEQSQVLKALVQAGDVLFDQLPKHTCGPHA